MNIEVADQKLTFKDFATDQEVRWCPGCGDYAILKAVQRTLADVGAKTENTVFVSGIGCSSRFPHYMETYGFHTIHGRAPSFATGIKLANPDLDVWIITGDGDGFSIGGNHMLHILRRNLDTQILLFNNKIYGLTKGQYSPTSDVGTRSPSTPMGSIDEPLEPCATALGAGARFVARSYDVAAKHLPEMLVRARDFNGTGFVEILQNCPVFNDGQFDELTNKKNVATLQLQVEHGQPLLFGNDKELGLQVKPGSFELQVVTLGENGIAVDDILVHDQHNKALAQILIDMKGPEFPTAMGVFYCDPEATGYETNVHAQLEAAREAKPGATLNALMRQGRTWTIGS